MRHSIFFKQFLSFILSLSLSLSLISNGVPISAGKHSFLAPARSNEVIQSLIDQAREINGFSVAVFTHMLKVQGKKKRAVTFTKEEIAKALERSPETIRSDLRPLVQTGLIIPRRVSDKAQKWHLEYKLNLDRWKKRKEVKLKKVSDILTSYGHRIPASKYGELKSKIDEILGKFYTDFNEALGAFKRGYFFWSNTSLHVQFEFVKTLARARNKEPSMLTTSDFSKPIPEFNNKRLKGLLVKYSKSARLTNKEALKELKKTLGIKDIKYIPSPYKTFAEALEIFKKGRIRWIRTTHQIQLEFVKTLARARNKEPGMLITSDFEKPIPELGKSMRGLLVSYQEGAGLTPKEALKELKKTLGIKDIKYIPPPYKTFAEALETFKKDQIRWIRTTHQIQHEFVKTLAKAVNKVPGMLNTYDFLKPIPEFNNKSLEGLFVKYQKSAGLTPKEALKELKQTLGIKDLITYPKKWQEKTKDWNRVCKIIEECMAVEIDPNKIITYLRNNKLNKEADLSLGREVQAGDAAAREAMVEAYTRVVRYYARRLHSKNPDISEEELEEVGLIALGRCVERFDPDKGFVFSTYISGREGKGRYTPGRIDGAMLDRIRDKRGYRRKTKKKKVQFVPFEEKDYMADVAEEDKVRGKAAPEKRVITEEEVERIKTLLSGKVSKRDREIFISHLKGETQRQIAIRLKFHPSTISQIVSKCRLKIIGSDPELGINKEGQHSTQISN